ncbi:carbon storage regulator [Pseudoneobacillus sp. C159]
MLGRKPGEYVLIDNNIKVTVIKSYEGHLRLEIETPKHISIVRGELWEENNIALEMAKKVEAFVT